MVCRDNDADEPASGAVADMDELDRYAAGVEREEVEPPVPSGVARARALGMLEEPAPPKKKKQRRITRTEMKRAEIRDVIHK